MKKQIKMSSFSGHGGFIEAQYDWPEDCYVQGGDRGVVLSEKGNYRTAFVEAFPNNPKTFVRGQGATVQEAETKAWEKYQRIVNCPGHEYERRGATSGVGYCKHCDHTNTEAFEPTTKCIVCNTPTNWTADKHDNYYCETHENDIPEEDLTESEKHWRRMDAIHDKMVNEGKLNP